MISIYLHLPFCVRKCPYCAFYSESHASDKMDAYVKRVLKEAASYPAQKVKSIYFGGGTPTALPPALLNDILSGILLRFPCDGEITIEANPATVTYENLYFLRKAGFNRISIGIQSLCDEDLTFLGRLHSAADAIQTVQYAKKAGFDNISGDLMFGLPGQSEESLQNTLETMCTLPLTHISTYSLSIEDGTPFAAIKMKLPDEDTERAMFHMIVRFLRQHGYSHYEISNFARPGYEAVHNMHYWQCGEYIGLGAGAHGYLAGTRYANVENIDNYLQNDNCIDSSVILTETDIKEEYYMLGLRMLRGIPDDGNPNIERLISQGLLQRKNGLISLTTRGIDIANYVITELFT